MMKTYFRQLPKVGDVGLAIPTNRRTGDWTFDHRVADTMARNGVTECWFQCFNSQGWVWSHGIVALVNGVATITQIG